MFRIKSPKVVVAAIAVEAVEITIGVPVAADVVGMINPRK